MGLILQKSSLPKWSHAKKKPPPPDRLNRKGDFLNTACHTRGVASHARGLLTFQFFFSLQLCHLRI